jgi:hypothetical protein
MTKRAKLRSAAPAMRGVSLSLLVAIMMLTAVSCTATRTSAPTTVAGVTRVEIKAGDVIRVLDKFRRQYTLKITALDATSLTGEALRLAPKDKKKAYEPTGVTVQMRYADIALLEVKQRSALRTAGAALVALEVIGMVVLAIEGVPVGIPAP